MSPFERDTAGVHFRRDEIEGILLGEASASSVLADFNATDNEDFEGFSLTTSDDREVRLNVNPAEQDPAALA
jgi:hypothetical protein